MHENTALQFGMEETIRLDWMDVRIVSAGKKTRHKQINIKTWLVQTVSENTPELAKQHNSKASQPLKKIIINNNELIK